MRLLILGAAGPYPERLAAFVEAGHQVWHVCTEWVQKGDKRYAGMVMRNYPELGATANDATEQLIKLIKTERIDGVYSLLNVWDGSNRATAALLDRGCPVPVIRHYKEHYFSAFEDERRTIEKSTGVIFINEESRDYFGARYLLPAQTACIDADLIPRRYLSNGFQQKLSSRDGIPHLLIAGSASEDGGRYDYRQLICELTNGGAHVHLYVQFRKLKSTGQLNDTLDVEAAYKDLGRPGLVHFHHPVAAERFVEEWSCYDAGLLHVPREDDPFRALNLPNRYSAYIAAGLPVAVQAGQMPAMQRQLEKLNACIIYNCIPELLEQLPDQNATARVRAVRDAVTYEAIFPRLMGFLICCIQQ